MPGGPSTTASPSSCEGSLSDLVFCNRDAVASEALQLTGPCLAVTDPWYPWERGSGAPSEPGGKARWLSSQPSGGVSEGLATAGRES